MLRSLPVVLLNEDIKILTVLAFCRVCVQLLGAAFHLVPSCCGTSALRREMEGYGNSWFPFAITSRVRLKHIPSALLAKKRSSEENRKTD